MWYLAEISRHTAYECKAIPGEVRSNFAFISTQCNLDYIKGAEMTMARVLLTRILLVTYTLLVLFIIL